ncbi:MAG: hypothetical protein ABJD97_04385 [Betaproteobacteria bacterium]
MKLHGVDIHQDHAGVGTGMPDELEAFRVHRLKEMDANALRCPTTRPRPNCSTNVTGSASWSSTSTV